MGVDACNGKWTTVMLLLNTMIGSGILNQPQVFQKSGIFGTLIVFAISGYFIWLGCVVLVLAANAVDRWSYQDLLTHVFGKRGEWWLDVLIVASYFGALIGYLEIVGSTCTSLLYDTSSPRKFANFTLITFLATTFVIFPLCLNRYYAHLGFISYISITCIILVLSLVLFYGPFVAESGNVRIAPDVTGMFQKLGSVVFALSCAPAVFHAYSSTKDATPSLWKEIVMYTCIGGIFLCIAMGLVGYLDFKDKTDGVIIDNFLGIVSIPFSFLLIVHISLYIPVSFIMMRFSVVKLYQYGREEKELGTVAHTLLTAVLLYTCMGIVIMLNIMGFSKGQAFGLLLDLSGGLALNAICFMFPSILYLKVFEADAKAEYWYHCVAMLIFGCFTFVAVLYSSIESIISNGAS